VAVVLQPIAPVDTRNIGRSACVVLGLVAVLAAVSPRAGAGEATDQLRPAVDRILGILDDPRLMGPAMTAERRAAIRSVLDGVVDYPDAARRALGPYWRERSESERTEFVALFRELVTYSYVTRMELYAGEKVVYLAESADDGSATVRTKIVSQKRPDLPVDYRMHRADGRWLVYDVLVEGPSLVANYRAQFHTIIQTSSYAELVRRIKSRLVELAAPPAAAMR
jgi:phospholipid transport system substrate-binding protein